MTVEVLRSFDDHAAGDIVDASGWLWTEQLIQQHYIRPVYDLAKLAAPEKHGAARRRQESAEV